MGTEVKITTEAKDNAYIVHMVGEIDISNLSDLESVIKPIIDNADAKALILDCTGLMFIDSKVVGYIAYLSTTFGHSERKLLIASANETINDILTLVGLTTIVQQFTTVDEALANI